MVLIPFHGKAIYAHERILSAGCVSFRDSNSINTNESLSTRSQKLLNLVRYFVGRILLPRLLNSPQDNVINLSDTKVSQDSFESAIKYMYGFKFKGVRRPPRLIADLAEVALIAQEFEITGLFEVVSEIANRAVVECFGNEAKLRTFLDGVEDYGTCCQTRRVFLPFAVQILGENFFELHQMESLHKTIGWRPELGRNLLKYLGDNFDKIEHK